MTQDEKKPLLPKAEKGHWSDAYSFSESHATLEYGLDGTLKVIDYDVSKLSTFRVFGAFSGTILQDAILLTEQVLITLLFFMCATPSYVYFNRKFGGDQSMNHWLDGQEEKMRAFSMILTMLAAFLLSFYTSITVARWWAMRTGGVGGIKAAAMELEMYINEFVTKDEQILSAIRRYARASLALVFMWRRGSLDTVKEALTERGILFEDEAAALLSWNHNLHESIWAWQTGIVTSLHKEGKIAQGPLLCFLLERCSQGREAVQLISTHLSVKVPMQYVHLLGVMVKLHNAILAVLMGILFGGAVRDGRIIICCQLFGRTLIMPFLFNAILLINAELSDPFDGGAADFPGNKYQTAIENDGKAFLNASKNVPDWIAKRRKPLTAS